MNNRPVIGLNRSETGHSRCRVSSTYWNRSSAPSATRQSDPADRERFEKVAADYQSELDAAAGTSDQQSPSVPTVTASSHATAATSEAGSSDAVSSESDSAPTSTDFQQETKD